MLKYVNSDIVFQEIPDEVTLAINISGCPCHCPGCHSKYLWKDIGNRLDAGAIDSMMAKYGYAVTCICFMGGDAEVSALVSLSQYIRKKYQSVKVGWYSGREKADLPCITQVFDYVKLGPYVEALGGLKSRNTNQRLYMRKANGQMADITERFWTDR